MTSHTVSQLLETMGILKTHNRPYTSNDNPFSECNLKTLKYCPQFPEQFESLNGAEFFCQPFLNGITMSTITQVFYFETIDGSLWLFRDYSKNRHDVLIKAYEKIQSGLIKNTHT